MEGRSSIAPRLTLGRRSRLGGSQRWKRIGDFTGRPQSQNKEIMPNSDRSWSDARRDGARTQWLGLHGALQARWLMRWGLAGRQEGHPDGAHAVQWPPILDARIE